MFSTHTNIPSLLTTMFVSGIILAPSVLAITPAAQDLANLRTVINAAAGTISDPNNPNLGWGFGTKGEFGTADLVNNITTTILRIKFEIDTNKTAWLTPPNVTDPTTNLTTPSPPTPTLPLTASMVLPSTAPTSTPTLSPDLSEPYIDYVAAMPNLGTALQVMGRAYHREMNAPVSEAIQALQQSMTTLQSACLANGMIGAQPVLRTIRASSTLETAQAAFGRPLNLPGRGTGTGASADNGSNEIIVGEGVKKRDIDQGLASGKFYRHQALWGRSVQTEKRRVVHAEDARVGVPFVV